jgi:hypothetical protein
MTPPTDIALAAAVRKLSDEFYGRIDVAEVREIVDDCYDRLIAHVPRTVHSYLLPWARNRLAHRLDARREATLTEILLVPVNRL